MLCWILTFWVPTPCIAWIGRMKRPDVQQAWREKLALNMLIWFVCGCAVFVIAILGNIICPTQYVFSTGDVAEHNYDDSPDSVYTYIRGEVFNLNRISEIHGRVVSVVDQKTILDNYGGGSSDDIFPIQVRSA